jgi:DNA-directed RNA polymerase subunit K/omega
MSDDDGDFAGDYEELDAPAEDYNAPGEVDPDAAADEEFDDELGLDDDGAGTDDNTDDDADASPDEEVPTIKAHPQRPKVDPILRLSNRPRVVVVVHPDERVTDNRLHKSEAAYIIAMRAQQIARYATTFTDPSGLHDPVAIAFKELLERRCPFTLRRSIGIGPAGELVVEEWNPREMTLPQLTPPVPLGGIMQPAPMQ